jgi:hypothetical protein
MDAGYALGNYRFYDTMNETWKIATYLSNVVGRLLSYLPFGNTWIGMNVYTSLLIGITAAATYLFMVNHQPKDDKKEYLLFISELMALSLCWAPSTILYHYLGYILMTVATLVLYTAIIKNNARYYIAAGVILGLCVAVRMPNITYMAFILPLWYYCFINRGSDEKWFGGLVRRTLYCIGGYLIGLVVPIGYVEIRYGLNAYPDMISSLFGMTDTATDYKPTSMITAMFGDYISYSIWLLVFILYIIIGVIFFEIIGKILKRQIVLFKILYCLGFLVVLRFCYGRGMFGLDFTNNFSMYKWLVVYLLSVILLCVVSIFSNSNRINNTLKLWAVFLLVTIFITPLGSNNGLYPIINNLFVVAPISVILALEFYKQFVEKIKYESQFVIKNITTYVMICLFVVSLLYGINYVFHDYLTFGDKRVSVSLKSDSTANGLLTTSAKAEMLTGLDEFLYENNLTGKELITYGNIPALSYIFNMKPAIYTTWGDLDSNPISKIESDLNGFNDEDIDELPLIILGTEAINDLTDESKLEYKKFLLIENFMADNNYTKVYENSSYCVYLVCE